MEFKLINEKENLLFSRKEVKGSITADKTPSYQEVKTLISQKYSVPEEAIKIKGIKGKFGTRDFDVEVNVYNSEDEKNKIEIKKKKETELEKKKAEQIKAEEEEKKKAEEEANKPAEIQEKSSEDSKQEESSEKKESKEEKPTEQESKSEEKSESKEKTKSEKSEESKE